MNLSLPLIMYSCEGKTERLAHMHYTHCDSHRAFVWEDASDHKTKNICLRERKMYEGSERSKKFVPVSERKEGSIHGAMPETRVGLQKPSDVRLDDESSVPGWDPSLSPNLVTEDDEDVEGSGSVSSRCCCSCCWWWWFCFCCSCWVLLTHKLRGSCCCWLWCLNETNGFQWFIGGDQILLKTYTVAVLLLLWLRTIHLMGRDVNNVITQSSTCCCRHQLPDKRNTYQTVIHVRVRDVHLIGWNGCPVFAANFEGWCRTFRRKKKDVSDVCVCLRVCVVCWCEESVEAESESQGRDWKVCADRRIRSERRSVRGGWSCESRHTFHSLRHT